MLKKLLISSAIIASSSFSQASEIFYTTNHANPHWSSVANDHNVDCQLLAGDNKYGLIVAGGPQNRTIKKITSYASGSWITLKDPQMPVTFLGGHNYKGPIVAGGSNNKTVKVMTSYAANTWKTLPLTPFNIDALAGDNKYGPIVANGRLIAYLTSYSSPRWVVPSNIQAPFDIQGMTGDNKNGVIAHSGAGNQIAYLNNFRNGGWITLPSPNSGEIINITGDNQYGPIITYSTGEMYYMTSYSTKSWSLLTNYQGPQPSQTTGNNHYGATICGW